MSPRNDRETSQDAGQSSARPQPRRQYLAIGQAGGASDIHLGVNAPPIWRLNGTLQPIWPDAPQLTAEDTAALAEGFLSEVQKTQLAERGDVDFAYANEFGRFRTSVVRQRLGIDFVFRIINTQVRTMDELGLPEQSEIADALSERTHPRHRLGRQRKIDHARGAGRADKSRATRAHHHARRSDRIHFRTEGLPHHAARSAHAHALVRRGVARLRSAKIRM